MKIKNRLSLYFALISSAVLLSVFCAFYLAFALVLRSDFFGRLEERASVTAGLFLQADELSTDSLDRVRTRYLNELPGEVARIYNDHNKAAFIGDELQYWPNGVINEVRRRGNLQFMEGKRQVIGNYYRDNQGNFVILVSAIDVIGNRRLKEVLEIMAFLFVAVGASLFLIGRIFAQESLSPLQKLIKDIRQIKATNLNLRVNEGNGKDEISDLARNFNQLLEHLDNAFEMQKTYIANASHELRTPVTSIIGEIEVALYHPRTEDEYKTLLQSILHDSARLKNTISSLMELAQVDADYTIAEQTNIRIDDLIWELQDYWSKQHGKNSIEVQLEDLPEDERLLIVSANRQLLIIALNNIISNGFKFSDNKPVTITLSADNGQIILTVKDQGIGIPEVSQSQIFNPFYRGDNAHVFLGSGIGLYIADKVIQLFKGEISFKSIENTGTVFTIMFHSV